MLMGSKKPGAAEVAEDIPDTSHSLPTSLPDLHAWEHVPMLGISRSFETDELCNNRTHWSRRQICNARFSE
jgi:hypothetical protein